VYAHKLQELIGGAYGEMTVTMQYLFQGWSCRMPRQVQGPDPKLHATYDGKQGEPSGPALGTEAGLAGKIKDALT
jgi:hypothetical protein